jgi:hypothetical protein
MLGNHIHRTGTLMLSTVMAILGVALIIQAATGSAGIISVRLLLGLLFLAAGAGRTYVELRRGRRT